MIMETPVIASPAWGAFFVSLSTENKAWYNSLPSQVHKYMITAMWKADGIFLFSVSFSGIWPQTMLTILPQGPLTNFFSQDPLSQGLNQRMEFAPYE